MTTVVNFIAAVMTGILLIGGLTVLLGAALQAGRTAGARRHRPQPR